MVYTVHIQSIFCQWTNKYIHIYIIYIIYSPYIDKVLDSSNIGLVCLDAGSGLTIHILGVFFFRRDDQKRRPITKGHWSLSGINQLKLFKPQPFSWYILVSFLSIVILVVIKNCIIVTESHTLSHTEWALRSRPVVYLG